MANVVQQNIHLNGSGGNMVVTMPLAQKAGNTNLVFIAWGSAGSEFASAPTDTKGNIYSPVTSVSDGTNLMSTQIWVCSSIAAATAGSNTITMVPTGSQYSPEMYVLEVADVGLPDSSASLAGTSATASSGSVATTKPNEFALAFCYSMAGATGPGTGWTNILSSPDIWLNIMERAVAATSPITATTVLTASTRWVQSIVTFLPASYPNITQIGNFELSSATTANPAVVNTPVGAQIGDVLFFFVGWYVQNGATITPPAGVTLVSGTRIDHVGTTTYCSAAVYQLVLTSAPSATYSFSVSPAPTYGVGATCICLRGAKTSAPVDSGAGAPTTNSGHSTAPTATGLTTTNNHEFLCLWWMGDSVALTTPFPNFIQVYSEFNGGNYASRGESWGFYILPSASTGATGNVVASAVINDWLIPFFAVVPASLTSLTPKTDALFFVMM